MKDEIVIDLREVDEMTRRILYEALERSQSIIPSKKNKVAMKIIGEFDDTLTIKEGKVSGWQLNKLYEN